MVINSYWYPEYDSNLDFWNVMYDNSGIMYQALACDDGQIAEHVVGMHNNWYQNEVFNTYADNVTLSVVNEIVRQIVEDRPEDADFWKTQILTDISQLPEAPDVLPF